MIYIVTRPRTGRERNCSSIRDTDNRFPLLEIDQTGFQVHIAP